MSVRNAKAKTVPCPKLPVEKPKPRSSGEREVKARSPGWGERGAKTGEGKGATKAPAGPPRGTPRESPRRRRPLVSPSPKLSSRRDDCASEVRSSRSGSVSLLVEDALREDMLPSRRNSVPEIPLKSNEGVLVPVERGDSLGEILPPEAIVLSSPNPRHLRSPPLSARQSIGPGLEEMSQGSPPQCPLLPLQGNSVWLDAPSITTPTPTSTASPRDEFSLDEEQPTLSARAVPNRPTPSQAPELQSGNAQNWALPWKRDIQKLLHDVPDLIRGSRDGEKHDVVPAPVGSASVMGSGYAEQTAEDVPEDDMWSDVQWLYQALVAVNHHLQAANQQREALEVQCKEQERHLQELLNGTAVPFETDQASAPISAACSVTDTGQAPAWTFAPSAVCSRPTGLPPRTHSSVQPRTLASTPWRTAAPPVATTVHADASQLLLRDKVMAPARSVPSMPLAGSVMEGVRSLRLDGMHSSSLHQLPVPSPTRPAPGVQGRTREPSPECAARSAPHLALAPCKFAFGSNSPRVLPSGKMDPHVNTLRSPAVPSSPSRSPSPCAFRPSGVSVCPPVIMRTGSGVPSWVAPTRRCQGTEAVS